MNVLTLLLLTPFPPLVFYQLHVLKRALAEEANEARKAQESLQTKETELQQAVDARAQLQSSLDSLRESSKKQLDAAQAEADAAQKQLTAMKSEQEQLQTKVAGLERAVAEHVQVR